MWLCIKLYRNGISTDYSWQDSMVAENDDGNSKKLVASPVANSNLDCLV